MAGSRRLDVQGLRAVAVLMVVAYHGGLGLGGGFAGVDVFFVISGFVITSSLARELRVDGRIDLVRFYGRRARRLLPALTLMLLVVASAGVLLEPVSAAKLTSATGAAAAAFSSNLYLASRPSGYFDVDTQLDPLLHTWTLGVEEQFYVFFPLVLFAGWLIGRRALRLRPLHATAALVAVAGAGSLAVALLAPSWSYYSPLTRAWEFAAGALLALHSLQAPSVPRPAAAAAGAVGVSLLCLTGVAAGPANGMLLTVGTPVLGATALVFAGLDRGNVISSLLATRPLVAVGDLSYSWYLWHWPLIVFAKACFPAWPGAAPVAALASLGPAFLSYRYVEAPVRLGLSVRRRRALALAAACVAVPLGAFLAVSRVSFGVPTSAYAPAAHVSDRRGCHEYAPIGARPPGQCLWATRDARGTVVLIGDSNAAQLGEAVIRADRRARLDTIVASAPWCPVLLGVTLTKDGASQQRCVDFVRRSLAWIVAHRPRLVIIGSRSDDWIEDPAFAVIGTGRGLTTDAGKEAAFAHGLRRSVSALSGAGIPVVVVHPIPELQADPGSCAPCGSSSCTPAPARTTARRSTAASRGRLQPRATRSRASTRPCSTSRRRSATRPAATPTAAGCCSTATGST
jgi:peptidoglycan/LPS O-acetylase OafA/YrhL